ncbi:hypothetical protein EYF80_023578 [Liparis tanakae]|uniref:Uncharacterized protein n=1 Tax=Liparis tanakae TaxID=230148 RepID=A0A4Z2HK20_9TELE|nr:hypothetical protein EYF80_023578 [Liparis tanakae]
MSYTVFISVLGLIAKAGEQPGVRLLLSLSRYKAHSKVISKVISHTLLREEGDAAQDRTPTELQPESCPRLRATIATALNLLRVPVLGLLAFCRFSRSSVVRLTPPRWSVHTNDTCILAFIRPSQ